MRIRPDQTDETAKLAHHPVHTGHAMRRVSVLRNPVPFPAQRSSASLSGRLTSSVEMARATRCAASAMTTTSSRDGLLVGDCFKVAPRCVGSMLGAYPETEALNG